MLKQISLYAVTTIIYILLSISLCQAQVDQYGKLQTTLTSEPLNFSDYYYSLDAIEEFKNKWVSIEQELNNSNDEWIGDYKAGMDSC